MPFRRQAVRTPGMGCYYCVVDENYDQHELASPWLESRFFSGAHSESTSAKYASSISLFLSWAERTRRTEVEAAADLHLFVAFLATTPVQRCGQQPRSASSINRILVAVREFYRWAIAEHKIPTVVLGYLFEAADPEARRWVSPRVRHRRREPRRMESPDAAAASEVISLIGQMSTARDRFMVLALAVTGLRIGQFLGLRRQDVHLVPDASHLGLADPVTNLLCRIPGEHFHVVRRSNPNGAWSKSRFDFSVPVPAGLLPLYDGFAAEREACREADLNDMLVVALSGPTRGEAISARNANKLFKRASARAGIRHIHPHMLRHFTASAHLAQGTSRDELQVLLGWSSIRSAEPYIHVSNEAKRAAVERVAANLAESQ
ncbi:tyrosine-type recombinase/integrase [Paenarthrobacter ureafaciens]|uniref:tyrosine-type recombinase/integrase n=2 Tax=Paenarthrobacter ureafaciens TaxID=37931 RepID=UPI0009AD6E49